jgi:hypothetical protein
VFAAICAQATVARAQAAVPALFRDDLIFVTVRAGDGPEGLFMLDTGAAASVIDARFAQRSGTALSGRIELEGRGGGVSGRQAQGVRLSIAGGPTRTVDAAVADLSDAARAMGLPLAGILGEDVLKAYVLTLDYRDQRLAITAEAPIPPDAVAIRVAHTPYVIARAVDGGRVADGEFQIDTGSNTAVEFWRPYARAAFDARGQKDVGLGVAGTSVIERGRIDELEVAGRRIAGLDVNLADDTRPDDAGPRYGGVIGDPAWRGLIVTLDQPRGWIWLR